jgi:hypothetical protein
MSRPKEFGRLLTEAVYRIELRDSKSIQIVQDELGYALDRESGGSAIEYWRKGHIPSRQIDVERLARAIIQRGALGRDWLVRFLKSADYMNTAALCDELFPSEIPTVAPAQPYPSRNGRAIPSASAFVRELAPFVVGPPIQHCRQFFGRQAELKRLFDGVGRFPLQNIALIGRHRSGKTSLLHHIRTITTATPDQVRPGQRTNWLKQPDRYRWVFVDFQDARMCSREGLLRYLLDELGMPVPEPCDLISFMNVVSRNLRTPTVILMDEIGAALEAPELDLPFWWSMRSLGSNQTDGMLGFVLTSHQPPDLQAHAYGKPSPFFNIFQRLDVGPLAEADAHELIGSSPRPFGQADIAWIIEQSGGWPACLQILCNTLLTALEAGIAGNGWREEGLRQMAPYVIK